MLDYDASKIKILKGLEAVRKRPGMYIGDLSEAYRRMLYEVIDNSVDEAIGGFCNKIEIFIRKEINNNGEEQSVCTVKDNGRGIPVDNHESGVSALQVIMTTLHAGGKFDENSYQYSSGLHGVGVSVTNALSEWLEAKVFRDGKIYRMRFEKGIPVTELEVIGTSQSTGTEVSFSPDFSIVEEKEVNVESVKSLLNEICLLNENLEIWLHYLVKDEIKVEKFFSSGLVQYFANAFIHEPIEIKHPQLLFCFGYTNKKSNSITCYTNNTKQLEGGTHLTGARAAIFKCVSNYFELSKKKKDMQLEMEDVCSSVSGILSLKMSDPHYSSQTKTKLTSSGARHIVESIVSEHFRNWLDTKPKESQKILQRVMECFEERQALEKAKAALKKFDSNASLLSGKLTDCRSNNPEQCELFIVEGGSAGGSACTGRDAETQAILPIQGKIMNAMRKMYHDLLGNREIVDIIASLRTGIGNQFDIKKLRYHKIIIMTDADEDGKHIFVLMVTFFYAFLS